MKVGDLVRRKKVGWLARAGNPPSPGWLALILSVGDPVTDPPTGEGCEFMHVGNNEWTGSIDNCWSGLFEVISEIS
jgi:hypothetical protein|tara:strand:+ start:1619 stop:1846 length:228 start_codon:yes stop_codon:yes gene_type:complete